MARFERDLIRERVRSGMANAKRKGVKLGRKRVPVDTVHRLRTKGLSFEAISQRTGLSSGLCFAPCRARSGVATITAGETTLYCTARVRFWVWVVMPDLAVTTIV